MIAVQSSGCAPVVRAFEEDKPASEVWQNAATFAAGLRVPEALRRHHHPRYCRAVGGVCVALSDDTIFQSLLDWSRNEGILLSPEGAAATAAYDHLLQTG